MADFTQKQTLSITCPLGLSPYLVKEVKELGYEPFNVRETGLELSGSLNDSILLNYWLRTAHRIHCLVDEKEITSVNNLRNWIKKLPWEEWIPHNGYFSVTSRVDHPDIHNDQFANLTVKDAVADRIRFKKNVRPDSGSDLKQAVLFLYWNQNQARIFIDTSGESLSRRNYRTKSTQAPMQESLAAALVMASGWQRDQHFINPMTGSGTLVVEAVLQGLKRAPASLRNNFGFMHLVGFEPDYYQSVRESAKKSSLREFSGKVIATDLDASAIDAAKKNATTAGVDHLIHFERCEFSDTPIPDGDGVVLINPPYGLRLEDEDLRPLYSSIGDFLKQKCAGKTGYVFTGNLKLAKKIGLRAASRQTFHNTTVECRLLQYDIYSGANR